MVEEAVGIEPFRENVVQAKTKLTRILTQEESVSKLLKQAQQTLNYWREQYDKYQEKEQLQLKRRFLERELIWAEVEKREDTIKTLQTSLNKNQEALSKIEGQKQSIAIQLGGQQSQQETLKQKAKVVFDDRLALEREIAQNQSTQTLVTKLLEEAQMLEQSLKNSSSHFNLLRNENLQEMLLESRQQIGKASTQVKENQEKMNNLEESSGKVTEEVLEKRINVALLEFKRANAIVNLKETKNSSKKQKIT